MACVGAGEAAEVLEAARRFVMNLQSASFLTVTLLFI